MRKIIKVIVFIGVFLPILAPTVGRADALRDSIPRRGSDVRVTIINPEDSSEETTDSTTNGNGGKPPGGTLPQTGTSNDMRLVGSGGILVVLGLYILKKKKEGKKL
ncbi:hypothetical protein A5882_003684 [Enterococcus sp. 4E1_DIV0656]|uniref:LPXTG cell wall anchor domain-containing protein n=1 Tax=Enterococcus sp. 4E1_DIV0656 TaxID=1834180 RepID=UPI000A3B49FF|nr:LPXTG cell wall anchor domain-containing protein [Enterococcus sp. 4E1_DIV0656]OTO09005.1 hypothetical protein A5882_003684 [Enterococcus sp. 4E1_DIV0656]